MRDPTRGGLATTLNELAVQSKRGILIQEEEIPLRREVVGACEMLGIDPLYLANEGKVIAVVAPSVADSVLEAMRDLPEGKGSVKIGQVLGEEEGLVLLETDLGATRILGMLEGEPLPRIC
jgi:hydrogenase expression/formation protein HypE